MRPLLPAVVTVALLASPAAAQIQYPAATKELQTVQMSKMTLDEFSGLKIESIPANVFNAAEGIAIFPNMIKGGFILGVNYGNGLLMVRRPDRTWSPPVMCTMGGGSLGFQAGVQASDIVLVFATPRSLEGILRGDKVKLGADASVAVGPIGRAADASTDARMGAEIYSYARARGLFLGVSVNGASLSVDPNANAMLYGRAGLTPADVFQDRGLAFHPEVKALIDDLNARTAQAAQAAGQPVPTVPPPAAMPQATIQPAMPQPAVPQPVPQPVQPVLPPVPQQAAPPAGGYSGDGPNAGEIAIPPLVPVRK